VIFTPAAAVLYNYNQFNHHSPTRNMRYSCNECTEYHSFDNETLAVEHIQKDHHNIHPPWQLGMSAGFGRTPYDTPSEKAKFFVGAAVCQIFLI
jgi:hypothetical protein